MITIYHKTLKDTSLKQMEEARAGSWVHVEQPHPEELDQLAVSYGLQADLLRDALDEEEMPRLEIEGETVYVFTRFAYLEKSQIHTAPILIALTPRLTVTVTSKPLPTLANFTGGKVPFTTTQKAKFLLQLITQTTGTYSGFLALINRQIRSARAALNVERISNRNFVQFVGLEDVLNDFLSELIPTNAILAALLPGKRQLTFFEEDRDLIEDLLLNNRQLIEVSKSNLKTITHIREAYSTIMTNNLNQKVNLLTALTIILTVPNIIAGIFGMNVPLPLPETPGSFWLVLFIITGAAAGLLYLFHKNEWM